jgi:transcription elongation factor Elf1
MDEVKDVTLEEIIPMCANVLSKSQTFWIKFTCLHCGSRQTSDTPNVIHMAGYTCENCGKLTKPLKYGLVVMVISCPKRREAQKGENN